MKKKLSLFLVGAMTLSMLTACGQSASSDQAAPAASNSEAASSGASKAADGSKFSGKITFTYRDDGSDKSKNALYRWVTAAYDSWQYKDQVELDVAPITASEGDYFTKIALQLADPGTCPDLVTEDTFQLPNDAAAGYLTDLTSDLKGYDEWNQYYESMQNICSVDGKTYGVPYCTDTRGLFYNRQILQKAGVIKEGEDWAPKNWDDILAACKKIKETQPDVVPFWCNSGKATGEATSMQTYEMLLYGTGERLQDDSGKWIVDSKGIRDSLKFLQDIYKNGYGPSLDLVLNGQASNTSAKDYMPNGKLGITLDGIWITGNWKKDGASPWPNYEKECGLAAMPTNEGQDPKTVTLAGGWGLSIPENADNKEATFDFLKHMMSKDVYLPFITYSGNICTRKDIGEMDEYTKQPFFGFATELLETAGYRPQNDKYSSVSTGIQSMVESVVSGTSIDDAVKQYASDTAAVVGEENTVKEK